MTAQVESQKAHEVQQSLSVGVFCDPETDNWIIKLPYAAFMRNFGKLNDPQVDGKAIVWLDYCPQLWPSQIKELVYQRKPELRQFWITVIPCR